MADKDIDFEELDRAIGALMEKQTGEEETIDELSKDASTGNVDEIAADLATKIDEDDDVMSLAKTGAISDLEADEIDQEIKDSITPEADGAIVQVKQRVPVGFKIPEKNKEEPVVVRSIKVPVPDDLLGKTVSIKPAEEGSFGVKVGFTPKASEFPVSGSNKITVEPKAMPESVKEKPKIESKPAPISEPITPTVTIQTSKKAHIPHRRGKYIDFVAAGASQSVRLKPLSAEERRARAEKINNRQRQLSERISDFAAKPVTTTHSVDFKVKLPAKDNQSAQMVTGNVQTDKTTLVQPDGEVVTVKQQTVELISRPGSDNQTDLVEENTHNDPAPKVRSKVNKKTQPESELEYLSYNDPIADFEANKPERSPFIPEAKVKKRPLGQPEPLLRSPSVTMHVPDRISTYDSGEQAALYRAELRTNSEEDKKSSIGWGILLIIIILIVAGLVYFFWGDIQSLLR